MKIYTLRLSDELATRLDAKAKAERRSITEEIRIAIEKRLATTTTATTH